MEISITLTVGEKTITLSHREAQELYKILSEMFEKPIKIVTYPQRWEYPWDYPKVTYDRGDTTYWYTAGDATGEIHAKEN